MILREGLLRVIGRMKPFTVDGIVEPDPQSVLAWWGSVGQLQGEMVRYDLPVVPTVSRRSSVAGDAIDLCTHRAVGGHKMDEEGVTLVGMACGLLVELNLQSAAGFYGRVAEAIAQ